MASKTDEEQRAAQPFKALFTQKSVMCVGKWLVRMSTFMKVRDAAHFSSPCFTSASVCLQWKMSKFCLSSNVFLNTLLAHFVGHIVVTIVCVKIINFFLGVYCTRWTLHENVSLGRNTTTKLKWTYVFELYQTLIFSLISSLVLATHFMTF